MRYLYSLRLVNVREIKIGNACVTAEELEKQGSKPNTESVVPGIGKHHFSMPDVVLLRTLCLEYMPFTLKARQPIFLAAELKRFPYSIDGKYSFQKFSCRLAPGMGRIESLEMHRFASLAINSLNITPDLITMNVGNGAVYLEVYLTPVDWSKLPVLGPPMGYVENEFTSDLDLL